MDRIGTDLQAPFGNSQHRIRMEDLCNTIEKNLQSMFATPERPPLLADPSHLYRGAWPTHQLAV
jgi:putative membrane protein